MRSPTLHLPTPSRSLSARLLVLTVAFVMLGEVFIYVPSIARFRMTWLDERLAAAHQAALAVEAAPGGELPPGLGEELLSHARVGSVAIRRPDAAYLMLGEPGPVDATVDLRSAMAWDLTVDAFATLARGDRMLRVVGASPVDPALEVEITMSEGPLRDAMLAFSWRILGLSVVISLFTAGLVFLALQWLIVRPMRRLTASLTSFRESPEDVSRQGAPSARRDEIGVAEREVHAMQQGLRAALRQRARLAAVGAAVGKISHDLKNVLSSAALVSDRLAHTRDPEVNRQAAIVMAALDRALQLCQDALRFARADEPELRLTRFPAAGLAADVGQALGLPDDGRVRWIVRIDEEATLRGDRDQLFRVLFNLGRNAADAILESGRERGEIVVACEAAGGRTLLTVSDTGPGLPPKARANLFQAFAGGARPGGTGLGLAIAREIMAAHGGDLELVVSTPEGTTFRLILPERPA